MRVNTLFLFLVSILQPGTPVKAEVPIKSGKLRPSASQCHVRLVAFHVPSLHKSSIAKPRKMSNKRYRVCLVLALWWLRGNSATDVGYNGETVQRVVIQKLVTCMAYRYTYVDRG